MADTTSKLLPILGLAAAGAWFGEVVYVGGAEGPAMSELNVDRATGYFPILWPKAAAVIVPTALVCPALLLGSWYKTGDAAYGVGAGLGALAMAYTFGAMLPTITALRHPSAQAKDAQWKREKLDKFYSMHAFRVALAAGALGATAFAMYRRS